MGKVEQETKIEKLRKLKDEFDRQGSMSDEAPAGRVVPCKLCATPKSREAY
jgi:hypothetical protein